MQGDCPPALIVRGNGWTFNCRSLEKELFEQLFGEIIGNPEMEGRGRQEIPEVTVSDELSQSGFELLLIYAYHHSDILLLREILEMEFKNHYSWYTAGSDDEKSYQKNAYFELHRAANFLPENCQFKQLLLTQLTQLNEYLELGEEEQSVSYDGYPGLVVCGSDWSYNCDSEEVGIVSSLLGCSPSNDKIPQITLDDRWNKDGFELLISYIKHYKKHKDEEEKGSDDGDGSNNVQVLQDFLNKHLDNQDHQKAYYELMRVVDLLPEATEFPKFRNNLYSALQEKQAIRAAKAYYESNKNAQNFIKPSVLIRANFIRTQRFVQFLLEQVSLKSILISKSIKRDCTQRSITLSDDNKRIMVFDPTLGEAFIYNTVEGKIELKRDELVACQMSADGATLLLAKKIQTESQEWKVVLTEMKRDDSKGWDAKPKELLFDNVKGEFLIHLTIDGSRALIAQGDEVHILKKKKGQWTFVKYGGRALLAMNRVGCLITVKEDTVCVNGEPSFYPRKVDTTSKWSLDDRASYLLRVSEGRAYVSSGCEEIEIENAESVRYNLGSLTGDGRYACFGLSNGSFELYNMPCSRLYRSGKDNNFDSIIALGTNEKNAVIGYKSGTIELLDIASLADKVDEVANLQSEDLNEALRRTSYSYFDSRVNSMKDHKPRSTRPVNISSLYNNLSPWLQGFVKTKLNVRTGWGPKATYDLMKNPQVPSYYKFETGALYTAGITAAAVGGYCAVKYLTNK